MTDDLIHKIVDTIIEVGQSDTKKFRLGETIRYSPSEILEILKQHKDEIFTEDSPLLKCPFCGGTAHIVTHVFTGLDPTYGVKCNGCGTQSFQFFETEEEAVNTWNRRPHD